jgi:HTH-type transcriptional regulator/antitoxin HigA
MPNAADIEKIEDEEEYRLALADVSKYFDREPYPGSKNAKRFERLLVLVACYEERFF